MFKLLKKITKPFRLMKLRTHAVNVGFSMVELMISIGIFMLITGILLANFPSFSSKISLENLAYEIALSIREAQIYGLSVKQFGTGGFDYGYGIHFDNTDYNSFILFADINANQKYDSAINLNLSVNFLFISSCPVMIIYLNV